jgi:hypothetical protein
MFVAIWEANGSWYKWSERSLFEEHLAALASTRTCAGVRARDLSVRSRHPPDRGRRAMIFIGVILGILGLACFMAVWDAVRRWDEDDHDF